MKIDNSKFYTKIKNNKSICLYCQKVVLGPTTSNIRKHYKDVHNIEVPRKIKQKSVYEECAEASFTERVNREGVRIDIDISKFLRCCVGLVAVNNLPLDIYDDDKFFKTLIAPYERKFGTNLNSRNIIAVIKNSCIEIQQIIREHIKNKMISLEFEIATTMDNRFLVINIHYIEDFKICINTIGVIMLELKQHHQAMYQKEEIIKYLQTYQIDMEQIYFSTSNNSENIPQISNIISNVKEEQISDEFIEEKCGSAENNDENIHSIFSMALHVGQSIAHTIQVTVYDILKNLETHLNECRDIVIQLQNTFSESNAQIQIPNLDNSQHWYSTYEMLYSLLQIRQPIETWYIQRDIIININWNFIRNFVVAFNPLITSTKKMETEQYIIGDFYRDWLCCEIELEDLFSITPYASLLHESMQKRKKVLLDNGAFLSALYLDPRFNFQNSIVLTEEQKSIAVANLLKTFKVLKKLEDLKPGGLKLKEPQVEGLKMELDSSNTSSNVSFEFPSTSSESTYSKLEQRMMKSMISVSNLNAQLTFQQKLTLLSNQKKVPLQTDILSFWNTPEHDHDIKKVASVALAVPVTQVFMEKAFNALSTIITKLESNVDNNTLNSLLLTKLNFEELNSKNIDLDISDHNISRNFFFPNNKKIIKTYERKNIKQQQCSENVQS
ncbi:uncharacterized protein LOC119676467 [Teleopsis dalmanni]|uniref:uncharacterized protein LOC119676467 n=1 Tax=Teleopsis dalmanni TaxID=139649 RepID=UPI0018CEF1E6|nr:uncharacterized protein LOC119676467 [Teleopsis dalmanni]